MLLCFYAFSVIVFQDVASDSGIGDVVFAGNDSSSHLSTEVDMHEKSLPGTTEGMPLTGAVEGLPPSDTAEGVPPSGAVDGKQLKLTVLGVSTSMSFLPTLQWAWSG